MFRYFHIRSPSGTIDVTTVATYAFEMAESYISSSVGYFFGVHQRMHAVVICAVSYLLYR